MSIQVYPNIAKVKRSGAWQNLPGFVEQSGDADIEAMIANKETSTTAQFAHAKDSFFILNDVLYQADANISVNGTIAVGTNCHVAVLGDEVTELINDIALQSEKIEELEKVFDTVSEMINDLTLVVGNNVKTNGYHTVYDGGGAYYKISTTANRACSIQLANNLYAVLIGNAHNTRQLGIEENDKAQDKINAYIADTSFIALTVLDPIVLKKSASGIAIDVIELIKIRRDNFTITFAGNGKFTLETLNEDYYRMLSIREASNVTVINPVLVGDADTIGVTTGEYGHGLYITDSENVTVYNGVIGKCFGDAVGIDDGYNITFIGLLYCYNCGRQGMSVIKCNGLHIDTIIGKEIMRTDPSAVIDFEPNDNNSPIIADVKNVYAYDCGRGVLIAGGSDKNISIGNVYSVHTSVSRSYYRNDFQINGDNVNNPKVNIVCGSIHVVDSSKTVLSFNYFTDSMSFYCNEIIVNGMNKTGSNSTGESTVGINYSGLSNVKIDRFIVINNTGVTPNLGIWATGTFSYKNVYINYKDDCSAVVTCSLGDATNLVDTHLITEPQSNSIQFINSSNEIIFRNLSNHFQLKSLPKSVIIVNGNYSDWVLYRSGPISGYSLSDPDSIITEQPTYWTVPKTVKILMFTFDSTNQVVTATKIA